MKGVVCSIYLPLVLSLMLSLHSSDGLVASGTWPSRSGDVLDTATFGLSYTFPQGIGYDEGYTTFKLFTRLLKRAEWWVLSDLRVHVLNNGALASNLGIGARYFQESLAQGLGVNLYYDYTHRYVGCCELTGRNFHQIGLGLEYLASRWDLACNGYFPIDRKHLLSICRYDYDGRYVMKRYLYASALTGIDLVIGYPFSYRERVEARCSVIPYYYFRDCGKALGCKLHLETLVVGYLHLDVETSYDTLFAGNIQWKIGLLFPKKRGLWSVRNRPVNRNEMIPVDSFCKWYKNF